MNFSVSYIIVIIIGDFNNYAKDCVKKSVYSVVTYYIVFGKQGHGDFDT